MNITFNFNQFCAFGLTSSRYSEIYQVFRSFTGIPDGVYAGAAELDAWLHSDDLHQGYVDEALGAFWMIRGTPYYKGIVEHAIATELAMLNVKRNLGALHRGDGSFKALKDAKKELTDLLASIEW